ncbi:MAG: sulfatase [Caldilineaceae bacterium]|nr:sulfatase [Caldilineaceae bacterium]
MTTFKTLKIILATLALTALNLMVGVLPITLAQTTQPNVVIIVTDDQNVDSLPVMRKLLSYPEGSWIKFNKAYANDSICCPARATLLTGQYAHHTGVLDNRSGNLLDDTNTLPVWLNNAGYQTGLIGRYLNEFPWDRGRDYIPPGWDYFKVRGIPTKADGRANLAVDFINTSTAPYFLYLAFNEPHHPARPLSMYADATVYLPPDPPNFNETDVTDKPRWIRGRSRLGATRMSTLRAERVRSQRALLGVDDAVQLIVDTLKAKGELDNTLIIFIGDNGYSWGSHRYIGKACVYEECGNIPLLIRYPDSPINREENRIVSNVDLASTIAEYAGITPGLPQDGESLIPLLNGTAINWNEDILLEVHAARNRTLFSIRAPGWKYTEYANDDKELYDLTADPYELQNQVNNPAYAAMRDELAARLHVLTGGLTPSTTAQELQAEEASDEMEWWLEDEESAGTVETLEHGLYLPQLGH